MAQQLLRDCRCSRGILFKGGSSSVRVAAAVQGSRAGVAAGRRRATPLVVLAAKSSEQLRGDSRITLRSEAEAPFRSLRLVLYGFSVASAGVALLISMPQLAASLGGVPGALATSDVATNIGVNSGAVALFAFLFRQDWQARERQLARLAREEALASLPLTLASGKRLRLRDLQGSARPVVVAGTPQQVEEALVAAQPHREALQRRGVLVVPLVLDGEAGGPPPPSLDELRWRVSPRRPEDWASWFEEQLAGAAHADAGRGLYVGLRLDGRVRASGMGSPPWARFAMELAPLEGDDKWTGFFDGFDGKV